MNKLYKCETCPATTTTKDFDVMIMDNMNTIRHQCDDCFDKHVDLPETGE